ncbi:anaerobic ribonucleoside triphosphate reductase activating protein [Campylobacter iguaniorum]|uniref:Anaerobic ribonucleoside triphosphate reductase activating protein n=1 Tax=Campylobacter iguaniorum TaxID=1244531 RepID=A0A076F926_9BACT|nr:anaerobic ribonucleoside-triphosphate reductase activating protein [Campylobacter iguaniorum]AII13952.1 anaerobic ribonucleoside triphosphate reductase activating protein [Campylobacter iguaniorum]ALV23690.1 anaerobic ribonucleoside triphosphate reductase activating protein [Campylobacter iguaniorum]
MIYDITPFSVIDYPGELAAILWFAGCNMRCLYCYNPHIVLSEGKLKFDDVSEFLHSRNGLLSAVVLSGGECTKSKDFDKVLQLAKELGYKTKVDTNGSNLDAIKANVDFIDFVALDFKAVKDKFSQITGSNLYENWLETLRFLVASGVKFEVRTTVYSDLLSPNDINDMANLLEQNGYTGTYCLQNYFEAPNLGNLLKPKAKFDPNLIKSNLKIELRNF